MKYRITHTTRYHYNQAVSQCHSEARLQPRDNEQQSCVSSRIEVSPEISDYREHQDFFGNRVAYFTVQQPHSQLAVTAISEVNILAHQPRLHQFNTCTWEEALQHLGNPITIDGKIPVDVQEAILYRLESELTSYNSQLEEYASASFQPGRPLIAVAEDINRRIYQDFNYDPGFTTIATPLSTVLTHRRGVCQDFAHLAIACFRSFGLPARYVSGYLETTPPAGSPKLTRSDASHAWFSIFLPGSGWLDFDPTNNCMVDEQHITLAWGRDYSDVTPLKGLAVGGGKHMISVSVDVTREN